MRRKDGGIDGHSMSSGPAGVIPWFGPEADHDLTVVIPAFNEESRLPWTLGELSRFMEAWGLDYRVVVADDGSSDRTATLTAPYGARYSTMTLDRHRGKGSAVRAAMLRATGAVVAFTDADLPYELSSLREGYERIRGGECEVVFGARDLEQSSHHARRRLSRTVATWIFRQLMKRMISPEVSDTQCGLKLFSFRAVGEIFSRVSIEGFAFDAEVVYLTQRLGLEFRRIPVDLVREYASTLSLGRDAVSMLREIVAMRWRNRASTLPPRLPEHAATVTQGERKRAA
jgi:dolichyl-phosphate beta-glucosyltransferase